MAEIGQWVAAGALAPQPNTPMTEIVITPTSHPGFIALGQAAWTLAWPDLPQPQDPQANG